MFTEPVHVWLWLVLKTISWWKDVAAGVDDGLSRLSQADERCAIDRGGSSLFLKHSNNSNENLPCTYMSYMCKMMQYEWFPGPAICCEHGLGCLDSVAFFVAPRLKCIFEQIWTICREVGRRFLRNQGKEFSNRSKLSVNIVSWRELSSTPNLTNTGHPAGGWLGACKRKGKSQAETVLALFAPSL